MSVWLTFAQTMKKTDRKVSLRSIKEQVTKGPRSHEIFIFVCFQKGAKQCCDVMSKDQ